MNSHFFTQTKEIQLAIKTQANVLITGPTGSGKSALAQFIHSNSKQAKAPFVSINLGCLNSQLIESELFGHEKGSFTGASEKKTGLLESANHGVAFLDEIGELPLHLQHKLHDFLQYKTIRPIGSSRSIQLNVRIIAATNVELEKKISERLFRGDLFHRLNVIPIKVKSLTQRRDEFDTILHYCLESICREYGLKITGLSEAAAVILENYSWPGNIRELRNALEYSALSTQFGEIQVSQLPQWLLAPNALDESSRPTTYQEQMQFFEKELLRTALNHNHGKKHKTADSLKLSISTLQRKLRKYELSSGLAAIAEADSARL